MIAVLDLLSKTVRYLYRTYNILGVSGPCDYLIGQFYIVSLNPNAGMGSFIVSILNHWTLFFFTKRV